MKWCLPLLVCLDAITIYVYFNTHALDLVANLIFGKK